MNQPNHEVRAQLGARLKFFREKKKLTQSQLAALMVIDQATIAKIESGKWGIGIDMIHKFCQALEIEFVFKNKLRIVRNVKYI